MHPAPLLRYWAIFFLQGDPEAKRTVANASFGAVESPRRLSCPSSSRQDWALSSVTIDNG